MSQTKKITRRQFLSLSGAALGGLVVASCTRTTATPAAVITAEPPVKTGEQALQRLQEGNMRYVTNKTIDPNQSARRRVDVAKGQHPFATILGCVDSRVPPELVFDRGLGDLFVIRTAGQVLDRAVVGSMEFGFAELGIPLIVVLGHENCGAIKATVEALEKNMKVEGTIGFLVDALAPAVREAEERTGDLVGNAVDINVEKIVTQLKESSVFGAAIEEGELMIIGGRYDLDTGHVEFLGEANPVE